ncbi:MAG: LysE family translocator [Rhodobacteraceae bacterium]|nr:LysE family translocator [Paracoccaceae bacterium]
MDWLITITTVAGGILFGAMSPGPSFVVVARNALAFSRSHGLATALGMGVGGAVFAVAAVFGLVALLTTVPMLYLLLKGIGAVYLFYLAYRMWAGSKQPLKFAAQHDEQRNTVWRSFTVGFLTQISNPKTAIVYASIFAVALPVSASYLFGVVCVSLIFLIETGWYSIVALTFSAHKPRSGYLNLKTLIDRLAASVMGALGLKILSDLR